MPQLVCPLARPLRILAVSDTVSDTLNSPRANALVGPIDVLLSCGDLSYSYMEFLVTQLNPRHAFYVHGNHDHPEERATGGCIGAPGGFSNLDRQTRALKDLGLILAGLEGSIRYRPDAAFQYTQRQMTQRARGLFVKLWLNRWRYGRALDIFVAHSPAAGVLDGPDGPHLGFAAFLPLLRYFRPRLMLHGHKHRYGPTPWRAHYAATEVVNVYPFRIIELTPEEITYGRLYTR